MNILTELLRLLDNAAPVNTITSYYRTKDGMADYQFSFEEQAGGTWRAFILRQPDYRDRPEDCHSTHRLRSGGRHYVCWTRPLRTEAEAREVARRWADKTQRYIRFGESF